VRVQANLEALQSKHSNFRTFMAPDDGHCSTTFDSALKETGFKVWLEALLLRGTDNVAGAPTNGTAPAAVNSCAECTFARVQGCDAVVGSKKLEDRCGICGGNGTSCAVLSTIPSRNCTVVPRPETVMSSGAALTGVLGSTLLPVLVSLFIICDFA